MAKTLELPTSIHAAARLPPPAPTKNTERQRRQFAAVLRKHGIAWDQTAVNKGDRK